MTDIAIATDDYTGGEITVPGDAGLLKPNLFSFKINFSTCKQTSTYGPHCVMLFYCDLRTDILAIFSTCKDDCAPRDLRPALEGTTASNPATPSDNYFFAVQKLNALHAPWLQLKVWSPSNDVLRATLSVPTLQVGKFVPSPLPLQPPTWQPAHGPLYWPMYAADILLSRFDPTRSDCKLPARIEIEIHGVGTPEPVSWQHVLFGPKGYYMDINGDYRCAKFTLQAFDVFGRTLCKHSGIGGSLMTNAHRTVMKPVPSP